MNASFRAPFLVRVFFAIALLFTIVGVIESAFIGFDFLTHGSLSGSRAPDLSFGIRSWTVHHALRPGYRSPNVNTNSLGLRSPEIAIPKPPETYRILLLGDSFTFGFEVNDADVFARRLEEALRTRYNLKSAEVVNAGVLSYCPLLEYLQYKQHLRIIEPDLVILNFDMSDVQDHLDYSREAVFAADGTPLYVTEPSLRRHASPMPELLSFQWLARRATGLRRRVESKVTGVPFTLDADRYQWTLDNGPEWDRELKNTLAPVVHLSTLLRHDNISLVLATYPQPWQVTRDATPSAAVREKFGVGMSTVHLNDRPFRKLERFATEQGLPFVNATVTFRADQKPAELFLDYDFHFTPRGHELYADVLARYISAHARR